MQVRTLLAALAEKFESYEGTLDAQAVGNALFGKFLSFNEVFR
jgi:hypothetical protein